MKGHYRHILCVMTDTHKQDNLIAQAIHIARSHQARLTIMLTLESLPPNARMVMESFSYLDSERSMEGTANDWINQQVSEWSATYPVKGLVRIGHPFVDVISQVVKEDHDLVIKLSDSETGTGPFGSNDMHLLRKCPCPVWVINGKRDEQYKSVVAALDLNYHYPKHEIATRKSLNLDILRHAMQISLLEFAQLHIVHVFDSVPENILRGGFISVDEDALESDLATIHAERDAELDRLLNQVENELEPDVIDYLSPQRHLVRGYPRKEIAATAHSLDADVVVMGTVARLGVPGFIMGGTAEETIQKLKCAVVGVKPQGFVTPIQINK